MLCIRTVSLASFVVAAALAGGFPPLWAQQQTGRARAPAAVAVRDVIKTNPHDGALVAPVMSDNWWLRMGSGQTRLFQSRQRDAGQGDRAPPAAAR